MAINTLFVDLDTYIKLFTIFLYNILTGKFEFLFRHNVFLHDRFPPFSLSYFYYIIPHGKKQIKKSA